MGSTANIRATAPPAIRAARHPAEGGVKGGGRSRERRWAEHEVSTDLREPLSC